MFSWRKWVRRKRISFGAFLPFRMGRIKLPFGSFHCQQRNDIKRMRASFLRDPQNRKLIYPKFIRKQPSSYSFRAVPHPKRRRQIHCRWNESPTEKPKNLWQNILTTDLIILKDVIIINIIRHKVYLLFLSFL